MEEQDYRRYFLSDTHLPLHNSSNRANELTRRVRSMATVGTMDIIPYSASLVIRIDITTSQRMEALDCTAQDVYMYSTIARL